jgi:HEAT repeat protein
VTTLSGLRASILRAAALAVVAGTGTTQDLHELAQRIAKEKDSVDPGVFAQIAAIGDREALRELQKGVKILREEKVLDAACGAFGAYAGKGELEEIAIGMLVEDTERKRDPARSRAATRALVLFGAPAVEELTAILEKHDEPSARSIACDALVPILCSGCDPHGIGLVMDYASIASEPGTGYVPSPTVPAPEPEETRGEVVRKALGACDAPEIRAAIFERLASASTPRAWKLLLIGLLADRTGDDVSKALAGVLGDRDGAIVLRVLEVFETRGGWEGYEPKLRALLDHPEASVRRAAVHALGRMLVEDSAWLGDVEKEIASPDPAMRMGAAAALAERRTPEALEQLHKMLGDGEWTVRAEVLQHLASLRRNETIPVLIDQFERERGRMREDVHSVLCLLTGLDHGQLPGRWRSWWMGEGATFVMPTLEAARAAEAERQRKISESSTKSASFYDVKVVSERVAFVLDVSGSMLTTAGVAGAKAGEEDPSRPTRMDVAKEQLSNAIRNLPDDTLFNIVFFESQVTSLDEHLLRMNKTNRARALRYVHDQYALGATALYPALKLVFSDPLVDTIYLLSDGAPTVGEITDIAEVRAEVARWNSARHVKINGITMGQESTLLWWLTQDTGGSYKRID